MRKKKAGQPTLPRPPSRGSKFRAVPTTVDGIKFASKKEAARYKVLRDLAAAGAISQLRLQPRFPLRVNGQLVCTYVADFQYVEAGVLITEDVKGKPTPVYRLKAKLMKAVHGIEIRET